MSMAVMTGCKKGADSKGGEEGGSGLVAKAEKVADQWVAQDWSGMRTSFDAELSTTLTEEGLAQSYSQITGAMGAFKARGDSRQGTLKNEGKTYDIVDVAATFEKGPMTMRVSFNGEGKVAGFYVLPADAK